MTTWGLWVPGKVTGKGRPRFVRGTGRTYTPEQTARYEDKLQYLMRKEWGERAPLAGPVELTIRIQSPIPVSWSKRRRTEANGSPATGKPDVDNVLKIVSDAGNGVLWNDDAQIFAVIVTRHYADEPGMMVSFEEAA